MCGIVGKVSLDGHRPIAPELIQGMMDSVAHRGPDGEGKYVVGAVGLGHRRLSIIDLNTGAQPLCNEDETVWITFNGEIYNYRELRTRLIQQGHRFSTETDTEVIVHLWEEHGVDCLEHLRGMFAFGIWDTRQQTLFLARDRIGIKPLYYCRTATALAFASEIKALLVDAEVRRDLDLSAIDRFLTYLYLPGNSTLFEQVQKLDPGHYLLVREGRIESHQYWDVPYTESDRCTSLDEAADELRGLLPEIVQQHMVGDVPVGFLASGGVDSTALLSYAVHETKRSIQTFTVGFRGSQIVDERPYGRLVSEEYGTQHRDTTISAEEFRDFLPRYVWHMEEPVCEPPAVALYYVSKFARSHVKVLLSGEGGDEAFGGYPEYMNYMSLERWKTLAGPFCGVIPGLLRGAGRLLGWQRLQKYGVLAGVPLEEYYYSRVTSPHSYFNRKKSCLYSDDFAHAVSCFRSTEVTQQLFELTRGCDPLTRMLYVDAKTWLPDDLLVKADKMTMAASLELRVPFLDHRLVEFAAALSPCLKVKGRQTKRVLRRAFENQIPTAILERKKAGFPVPYGRWLRGELREFVGDVLLNSRALSRGYFRRDAVDDVLAQNGQTAASPAELFSLVTLELWHRQFVDSATVRPLSL